MNIVLIAGGQTAESQGTLGSAAQLAHTARSNGHNVHVVELPEESGSRWDALATVREHDIVIPLVSGLEGTLEFMDVPYVGSPPDAAALAANKVHFNALVSALGLNKVPYEVHDVARSGIPTGVLVPGPWYVKPARLGASYGITRVESPEEIFDAVRTAADHDSLVLIEQEVPRPFVEVEVAAIVGETTLLAPPMETIAPGALWRDVTWKYSTDERPALYSETTVALECTRIVRSMIERAGLTGPMRFDLFVSGDGTVFVGEVNALPGHGVASTFPRIFELVGVDRSEQLEAMLTAGIHAHASTGGRRARG